MSEETKSLSEQLAAMLDETSDDDNAVPNDLEKIASELISLHTDQRRIQERIAVLKTAILDGGLEEGAQVLTSDGKLAAVVRRNGARFDEVTAREVLPQPLLDMITVPMVDAKVAKAKLPPDMYKQCRKPGKVTVVLK